MGQVHEYSCNLTWSGSTGQGYDAYDRTHRVSAPPAGSELTLTSDPAFRGDPRLANPEQLLLVAASSASCSASSRSPPGRGSTCSSTPTRRARSCRRTTEPMRITRIELRPRIVIAGDVAEERIRRALRRPRPRGTASSPTACGPRSRSSRGSSLSRTDRQPLAEHVSIPRRFNGPLENGQGGYSARGSSPASSREPWRSP